MDVLLNQFSWSLCQGNITCLLYPRLCARVSSALCACMTGFTRTAALTGNWPRPAPRAPRCVWPRAAPLIPPHIRAQNQGGNSILGPNLPHNWTWILQKMIHFSRARVGNISLLTSGWRLPLLAMTRLVPPVSCVQHGHGESKSDAVCILHPIRTVVRPSWSLTWLPCFLQTYSNETAKYLGHTSRTGMQGWNVHYV